MFPDNVTGVGGGVQPKSTFFTLHFMLFQASLLIFMLMLHGMGYGFPPFIDDGTEAQ